MQYESGEVEVCIQIGCVVDVQRVKQSIVVGVFRGYL